MHHARRLKHASCTLALLAAASMMSGCETQPLAPRVRPAPTAPVGPPTESTPVALAQVKCTANREDRTVTCDPVKVPANGVSSDIIVGGQNIYVTLASSNVNYVSATNAFTFDVTLRNLIPQPIGTSDGTTVDPAGMKIFFHSGPTVLSGSGTITVDGDGVGSFTGSNQPYFLYTSLIPQYGISSPKQWTLTMPPTVVTFDFIVYVSAPVQFPGGYVQVQSGATNIRADGVRQLAGTSRTAVGNTVPGQTVTWTSADTSLATVDASGLVSGVREGPVTINATDGIRNGLINLTITPIKRLWSAGASTTAAETGGNWTRGVVPTANDTLDIPLAGLYPSLNQNKIAASLIVENNASFNINAFTLTLSKGLTVGTGATTGSTTGQIRLTGQNFAISSGSSPLPRLTIANTGFYTLSTNVTSRAMMRIDAGRVRIDAVRMRIDNQ